MTLAAVHQVISITEGGSPGEPVSRELAHQLPGILHLAVSVAVVDPQGRWLLQQRAASKAAFPGRWANACCTHPKPGESPEAAGVRRVYEELGLTLTELRPAGTFTYRALDPHSGLVEHELDYVFVAVADTSAAVPDPAEIAEIVRLPYEHALDLATSEDGAPWAAQVLRQARASLGRASTPPSFC